MSDNRGNRINYINKEEINKIETKERKISLKGLYNVFNGSVATVIGFIASNKLFTFIGGLTQDELIKIIAEEIGKLKGFLEYAEYTEIEAAWAKIKISLLENGIGAISYLWNLAVAYPAVATIVVTALIAGGAYLIGKIPQIILDHSKKSGQEKKANKSLSK